MLLIPRNRDWVVVHTITDHGDISVPAGMSEVSWVRCQIRTKDCLVGSSPILVIEPLAELSGPDNSVLTISLSAAATSLLVTGDYHMDAVADTGEVLLPPEVVRVVNHPTLPGDPVVPDFVVLFNLALIDS